MQTVRRWVSNLFSWRTLLGTSTGVALLVGGFYGGKKALPLVERLSHQVQAALVAQIQRETRLAQAIDRASIGCPAASAALLPLISERMRVLFEMEPLRHMLRTLPRGQTERKVELWNQLKVTALSRLACTAYSVAATVAFIRVLLVSMAKYEDECRAAGCADGVDFQAIKTTVIERGVSYVRSSGLPRLADHLRAAVEKATAGWDPAAGKQVTLTDIMSVMSSVRRVTEFGDGPTGLEGASGPMSALYSPCPLIEYIVPQVPDPTLPAGPASSVLDLTWDMMESPAFQAALRASFDLSFVALKAAQVPAFSVSSASQAESRPTHLAKVLAGAVPAEKRFLRQDAIMASVVQPVSMNPTLSELCHTLYSRSVVSNFSFPKKKDKDQESGGDGDGEGEGASTHTPTPSTPGGGSGVPVTPSALPPETPPSEQR